MEEFNSVNPTLNLPQTPKQNKRSNDRMILVAVAGVILLLLCCCCSFAFILKSVPDSNSDNSLNETTPTPKKTSTYSYDDETDTEVETKITHGVIGEEVYDYDFDIIVRSISDFSPSLPDLQVAPDYKFVSIDVEMENRNIRIIYASDYDFSLKDSAGYVYETSLVKKNPTLPHLSFSEGEKVRGFITFQIPVDAKGLKLIYMPDYDEELDFIREFHIDLEGKKV